MALFKNMSITYQGMALFAKAQAGQEIHFTKMQVGGGQIGTQNPATLVSLIDPKLDISITSIIPNTELKNATIIGNVNNKDVKEALYICEMGLFAKDPDVGEILYGYVSCGQYGDYYAPESQGPYNWQYQIAASIGNAANVTAELSQLIWDYGLMNSTTDFIFLSGGNQKEINKSIDKNFKEFKTSLDDVSKQIKGIELTADKVTLSGVNGITSNNVKGAIQELFTNADNAQKGISEVIGSPLSAGDTLDIQKNKIQGLKNTFASNLTAKEQNSNGNESLQGLINKVANIETNKKIKKTFDDIPSQSEGYAAKSVQAITKNYIYRASNVNKQYVDRYTEFDKTDFNGTLLSSGRFILNNLVFINFVDDKHYNFESINKDNDYIIREYDTNNTLLRQVTIPKYIENTSFRPRYCYKNKIFMTSTPTKYQSYCFYDFSGKLLSSTSDSSANFEKIVFITATPNEKVLVYTNPNSDYYDAKAFDFVNNKLSSQQTTMRAGCPNETLSHIMLLPYLN